MPESLTTMLPRGLKEAMSDALHVLEGVGSDSSMLDSKGKGKGKGGRDLFVQAHNFKGKGSSKGKDKADVHEYWRDIEGKGKGKGEAKGRGKGKLGSYDSFATNVPMAGSFATRAPDRMSFQTDVLGSRSSFAQLRSDESFAAGLPPSAARAGKAQLPVAMSFVAGPSQGMTTCPTDGSNTRMPTQSSFFMPTQNTEPPQQGCSTRPPQCGSFPPQMSPSQSFCGAPHPASMSQRSRDGFGMEPINEYAGAKGAY